MLRGRPPIKASKSFSYNQVVILLACSIPLGLGVCIPPRQGIIGGSLGPVFLLGLAFAMAAVCASRAVVKSAISCRMASKVMAGVSDVDTEIMIQMMEMMMEERDKLETIRYLRLVSHDVSDTSYLNIFLFQIPEEVEEEDGEWIRFLGSNSSLGIKKYRGLNNNDGGNTGDGVKIAGGVIGSGDEIGEITDGIILEFSEELKEMLPDEAGK
ncbi:hypothetical protein Tco_0313322 [Tanacetum coccineum]